MRHKRDPSTWAKAYWAVGILAFILVTVILSAATHALRNGEDANQAGENINDEAQRTIEKIKKLQQEPLGFMDDSAHTERTPIVDAGEPPVPEPSDTLYIKPSDELFAPDALADEDADGLSGVFEVEWGLPPDITFPIIEGPGSHPGPDTKEEEMTDIVELLSRGRKAIEERDTTTPRTDSGDEE